MNRRRQRSLVTPLPLIAVLFVGACTMWGDLRPVEGWPELRVREHSVPHHVMRDRCTQWVPWYMNADACAVFNLLAKTCDIFYSADFPPPEYVRRFEREKRCKGYGSAAEREYLRRVMEHSINRG